MKKFTIIGLAICFAFALAAPVMAVDVDFSGNYHVRGAYVSHWDLSDKSASTAYMDMRFRLQTVFKASDILSVTTRFDAFDDRVWGTADDAGGPSNVHFKRVYMTIKAPIGTFDLGRMPSGAWGTTFIDTAAQADRIKYSKTIDNLSLTAVFQKTTEADDAYTKANADTYSDSVADFDSDSYYLLGKYKAESTTVGLQLAFTNDKTTAAQTLRKYGAYPYFVSKFGPLAIQGELAYNWGQTEYDSVAAGGTGAVDTDIKELAYNLEATYNVGPASIMAGYAFISGDGNGTGTDNEDSAFGSVGDDWAKLFILTGSDVGALNDLAGVGNLSASGAGAATLGAKIIYGGVTFSPLENLELGVVVGTADADELPAGNSKDDYGLEYDFTLNWEIYDNLTYNAVVAFLDAGDLWWEQQGSATEPATFDNTYALFHQLELSF
jgi:hypothetical protein